MQYHLALLGALATSALAAPATIEQRAVGTLYRFALTGNSSGVFPVDGGEWNVTRETGLGQRYGRAAVQSIADDLAHIASQQFTADGNPRFIQSKAKGAKGGTVTGTFEKTNTYLSWAGYNSTQWSAIFNAAVTAVAGEQYPKNSTYTFIANINKSNYQTPEGDLTVTFA